MEQGATFQADPLVLMQQLISAAGKGDLEAVQSLLQRGTDVTFMGK